jgi:branched-chain amino acid transport system substrate-binding protein
MKRGITAIAAIGAIALLAGCTAGESTDTGGGEAAEPFKISVVIDETGPGGFAGSPSRKGVDLAIAEINDAGGIDGRLIEAVYTDSATDAAQATAAVTQAVSDPDVEAIVYGVIGSTALGVAPVAQSAGVPLVLLQATLKDAIDTGDYIFRTSYAQTDYFGNVIDYWEDEGVETVAILAHEDSASGMAVVNNAFIPEVESRDMELFPTHLARTTDSDYTAQIQAIIAENPDAVYCQILGTPIVTIVQTLRNLGYEGEIGASVATAGGVLTPLGDVADGVVYPNSYSYATDLPAGQAFAKAYEKEYGEKASNFAVDGYDAIRLIAAGAEEAGVEGLTHETLQKGILAVTEAGLPGSPTADPLVFKDRAGTGPGVLVRWEDGGETIVPLD